MATRKITYGAAMKRLEEIMDGIENNRFDIDELVPVLKEAKELMKALYDTCMVHADESGINGLVKHGTYAKKSPYNTCTEAGVDECVSWGDYYWMEALVRLGGTWKSWW